MNLRLLAGASKPGLGPAAELLLALPKSNQKASPCTPPVSASARVERAENKSPDSCADAQPVGSWFSAWTAQRCALRGGVRGRSSSARIASRSSYRNPDATIFATITECNCKHRYVAGPLRRKRTNVESLVANRLVGETGCLDASGRSHRSLLLCWPCTRKACGYAVVSDPLQVLGRSATGRRYGLRRSEPVDPRTKIGLCIRVRTFRHGYEATSSCIPKSRLTKHSVLSNAA